MKTSEVIRGARNVLFERGWTKHYLHNSAGNVCLRGALMQATAGRISWSVWDDISPAESIISGKLINGVNVAAWNNAPGRTFDEVIEVLDKAEKIAEQMEAGQ